MNFFKNNSEWIWRIITFLLIVGGLYLNLNYVTRPDYKVDQEKIIIQLHDYQTQNASEHSEITKALSLINQTLVLMNSLNSRMEDHEARLRNFEQRQNEALIKLSALDIQIKLLHKDP